MIYEVAVNTLTHRHILKSEEELPAWAWENGKDKPLYTSVYCYSPEDRESMELLKASDWAHMRRHIQWVPIDIDRADNSAEETIRKAAHVLHQLSELGVQDDSIKCYFSGRGYHILIHEGCFNFIAVLKEAGVVNGEPFLDLPYIVKETMLNLPEIGSILDPALYQRNGFLRTTYSLNQKSGLYKIPVSIKEIMSLDHAAIEELAKTRREDFVWESEYCGDGELEKHVVTHVPSVRSYSQISEPQFEEACIYHMLSNPPQEGSRNNMALRIASHMRKSGIPSEFAKTILLEWNNRSLDEGIIIEKVESAYNRRYNYGCNDNLRAKFCSTRCKHYARKDVVETPKSFEELIEVTKKTNFLMELENGIDLAAMLHLNMYDSDYIVTRGEVVSLIGMTKAGKSTIMRHIALGLDFVDMDKIHDKFVRPTVYYTGEEAPEYWIMNCCKVLENCSKSYMLHNQAALLDKWLPRIRHIMPLPTTGKLSRIEDDIKTFQPEQIFLDTLDHFVDKERQAAGIEQAMLYLQEIASKYGVKIFLVSQINRQDSREGIVNLFSGKGSGAIENQSRKVIGLSTTDMPMVVHVELLANSYGGFGQECDIQMFSSQRMKKL